MPVAIGLEDAEKVSYDLLLPVQQQEGLSCPGALGVAQIFDKGHGEIGGCFVVMAVLRLKGCGLVPFQFFRVSHLLRA